MKNQYILLLAFFWLNSLLAQDPLVSATDGIGLPYIIPASPEVASIAKYGDIPINLSSGQIQLSVPLYQIKVDNFVLPIGLTYSYSGLKVEETPGRMGLGWTLNAGGVLSRQIRGIDDFNTSYGYNGAQKIGKNYVIPFIKNTLSANDRQNFVDAINKKVWDSEPDKFSFRVGEASCSFFFDEEERVVFKPHRNYKVEIVDKNVNYLKIIVTDDKGIRYHFTGDNDSESTVHDNAEGGLIHFVSARYITKIELPSSREINFEYEQYTYSIESISQSERKLVGSNNSTSIMNCNDCKQPLNENLETTTIGGKLLKKITFPEGEIVFDRQSTSTTSDKSVKEIIIKDSEGNPFLTYGFTFSNFESTGHFFKLDNITKKSKLNNVEDFYQFEYNSGVPTFSRSLLYKQDIWGYYNSNSTTKLIPTADYSNREPDYIKSVSGALTKISYPTGGFTEIDYEANKVNNTGGDVLTALGGSANTVIVGGIRVKKTSDYTHTSAMPAEVNNYEYLSDNGDSSGVLHSYPDFERNVNFHLLEQAEYGIQSVGFCNMIDYYSQSTTPLSVLSSVPVLYKRVTSKQTGNGKTISNFSGSAGGSIGFPYAPPIDKTIFFGKLEKSEVVNEAGIELIRNYQNRSVYNFYDPNFLVSGDTIGRVFAVKSGLKKPGNNIYDEDDYMLEVYFEFSKDYMLESQSKHELFDGNILKDSVSYQYDPAFGFLKKTTKYLENSNEITSINYYPHEVEMISSLPGEVLSTSELNAYKELVKMNKILTPVQIENEKNNNITARKRILYNDWGNNSSTENRIIEPIEIKTSKSQSDFQDRVSFIEYDNLGNLLEVSLAEGSSISYIWGYDNIYPVAKIENASISDIENLNSFGPGYDLGDSGLSASQESDLRSLSDALVTTFQYDPMIGIISSIDPRGRITYFHYDDFNRLEYVVDHDGNILSKNEYNYRSY